MYTGFKMTIKSYDQELYERGLNLYTNFQNQAKQALDNYINIDGKLDGTQIQQDWFPGIKADIFLSHSHKDRQEAIIFAGILSHFGITVFIDSCIWGYADTLLRSIDDVYCMNDDRTQYLYKERNKSTSHVHMMLSTALNMMMDKCEAIFFLNTPNSITTKGTMEETSSPWLYAELAMTRMIRRRPLGDYRPDLLKSMNETVKIFNQRQLDVTYQVNTGNLTELSQDDLKNWMVLLHEPENKNANGLDLLYSLLGKKKR